MVQLIHTDYLLNLIVFSLVTTQPERQIRKIFRWCSINQPKSSVVVIPWWQFPF